MRWKFARELVVLLLLLLLFPASAPDSLPSKSSSQDVRTAIGLLGILTHLAYVTASLEQRVALEDLGFFLGSDVAIDIRFPSRQAIRSAKNQTISLLGKKSRSLFLLARANPVALHAATIETVASSQGWYAEDSKFVKYHASHLRPHMAALLTLIEEARALLSPQAMSNVDALGEIQYFNVRVLQEVRAKIDRIFHDGGSKKVDTCSLQGSPIAIMSPFLPPMTGLNAEPVGSARWIVVGPSPSDQDHLMLLAHELLHLPVHSFMAWPRLRWTAWVHRENFLAIQASKLGDQGYPDWRSYLEEGLVRALSYEVAETGCRTTGFLLEAICPRRLRQQCSSSTQLAEMVGEEISGDSL